MTVQRCQNFSDVGLSYPKLLVHFQVHYGNEDEASFVHIPNLYEASEIRSHYPQILKIHKISIPMAEEFSEIG